MTEKKADVFSAVNLHSKAKRRLLRKNSSNTASFGSASEKPKISTSCLRARAHVGRAALAAARCELVSSTTRRADRTIAALRVQRDAPPRLGRIPRSLQGEHILCL